VTASAQSMRAGVHLSSARWSEFDGIDKGIGGRVSWMPVPLVGVEGELTWYPKEFAPDSAVPFSRRRVEGLFGATVGPRVGRWRPFARAAAGFLKVGATSGAFACIAIFPPPLPCVLAGGQTLPAYEIGGGLELDFAAAPIFMRADFADRILKYPGPTLNQDFTRNDEGFLGHAFHFTIAAGIRF